MCEYVCAQKVELYCNFSHYVFLQVERKRIESNRASLRQVVDKRQMNAQGKTKLRGKRVSPIAKVARGTLVPLQAPRLKTRTCVHRPAVAQREENVAQKGTGDQLLASELFEEALSKIALATSGLAAMAASRSLMDMFGVRLASTLLLVSRRLEVPEFVPGRELRVDSGRVSSIRMI